jgi:hypothetical protein
MKVALCLYGHHPLETLKKIKISRDRTLEHWKKHVLNHNNVDVFFHTWSHTRENDLVKKWKPVKYIAETQIEFDKEKTGRLYSGYSPKDTREQVAYSHTYSIMKSVELKKEWEKEHNFEYDMVMIARFDLLWFTDVHFDQFDPSFFHVAKWSGKGYHDNRNSKKYNSIAGVWFFSNSKNIDKFGLTLHHKISKFIRQKINLNAHLLYRIHVEELGMMPIVRYEFDDYYDWNGQRFFIYPHYPNGDRYHFDTTGKNPYARKK